MDDSSERVGPRPLVVIGNEQCLWGQRNSEVTNLNISTSMARLAAAILWQVELRRNNKI